MKQIYLYITPFFPSPTSWRGAYCYDFVCALQKTQKYSVVVFLPGCGNDYDYQGIRVRTFQTKKLPSNILPFLFRSFNERSFIAKVRSLGIDWNDVAVCHGNTAMNLIYPLAAKKQNPKIKALIHHHDLASFGMNLGILRHCIPYNFFLFPVLRRLHEKIDLHVFLSELSRKSFLSAPDASWSVYDNYRKQFRWLGFYRPTKVKDSFVLFNGLDDALFHPPQMKHGSSRFTIGCVSNFCDVKDHLTLLRALAQISPELGDWHLRLVGSGDTKPLCEEFIKSNNLASHTTFEREVDHSELPSFYQSLDLFVLPSYFEGFGCVFTEAHASGVPFITTTHCGAAELLDEPEKWTIEPHDDKKLAELILNFYRTRPSQTISKPYSFRELLPLFLAKME